jgi:hypothetical protein
LGAIPASAKVVDGRRRGAIHPSHCVIERPLDRQRRPTHSRRQACYPAVPIQENRVWNLQSRDKSMTRNTLNREGLTLKSTRSVDAAGLAPPTSARLLWRPAAAVACTTSPSFQGRRRLPLPHFGSSPPSEAWESLAMVVAEIGSLGIIGDGRQKNSLLRWDRLGGGMNRNCSIFYVVGSSSCTLPFLWGMLFPQA